MILSFRQRHRHVFIALGICLPIAFAVGIAARKPAPTMASLPKELDPAPQLFRITEWDRTDLFTKTSVQVRMLHAGTNPDRRGVQFFAPKLFVKPDLIVYWVLVNPSLTNKLPDEASLLGAFDSSVTLPLPTSIEPGNGVLVLYSLADQVIVDVSKPISLLKQ